MHSILAKRIVVISFVAASLAGCAGVNFYSDPALSVKTGIPIYGTKPYVLVSRTGSKDKPVDVSIVYLPDNQRIIYADPRSGLGSAKLTLALANGQLTSFGQETDPKFAELLASVGGLMTAHAGALKTRAEADSVRAGIAQSGKSPIEIGKGVAVVADDMKAQLAKQDSLLNALTAQDRKKVDSAQSALAQAAANLQDPAKLPLADQNLAIVKAQAAVLAKMAIPESGATKMAAAVQLVHQWADQLQKHFADSQPEKPDLPDYELYEIVQDGAKTTLKRLETK